jgi:hypothetical protein
MLLEIRLYFRCFKVDGAAITEREMSLLSMSNPYAVDGLGEEQRSVNIGTSLQRAAFKGRGVSDRFYQALGDESDRFIVFLASVNQASFQSFVALGIKCDLLLSFKVDEDTMDFEVPLRLISEASRLGLPVSILVDPFAAAE